MSDNNNNLDKRIYNSLEKIIFKEEDFKEFKEIINSMNCGEKEIQLLKNKIVASRLRILKEIAGFFPYHINTPKASSNSYEILKLKEENKEKTEFLEELGNRINNLYIELSKEKDNNSNNMKDDIEDDTIDFDFDSFDSDF